MALPSLVFTDIDGVWTDGGMYYDALGNEMKRFNTADSAGVRFLKELGIPTVILTGERTRIVEERALKLNIPDLYQGVEDKLGLAQQIAAERGLSMEELAFIGDDIGDLPLLKEVGYSAAPWNAPSYVKEQVDRVIGVSGGDGAYRSFIEELLEAHGVLRDLVEKLQRKA
jgi:3-deoxy-D-manno-octulosonate 8-phosphate phosphatase (KDO 8-P phosphatase)